MSTHGVGSEVGRLRAVILHRPGNELRRLTPRNSDELLFDGVPWVDRAQEEHDRFAQTLRDHGVEVLYLRELLAETLEVPEARDELLDAALRPQSIGPTLAETLREHLTNLPAEELAEILMGGMAHEELPVSGGLVDRMTGALDFIIRPLPNLLFTRDSSVWLDNGVAVTSLAMTARRRESTITAAIYRHHPRFEGTELLYGGSDEEEAWLEGGDVLVLAPGVAGGGRRPAHQPGRRGGVRPTAVRRAVRAQRARRPDLPGPRDHASRHRVHDGRPRQGRDVPADRRLARGLSGRRTTATAASPCAGPRHSCRRRRARWGSSGCESSTPAWIR